MRCDIIIPVWNLKGYTERCVESIIKNTEYPYRLIVVDNGSEKETREYLEALKKDPRLSGYILIRNEENQGYTIATNQGLEVSDAEYVCLHNNDTIAMKGWLKEMVRVAEASSEIGILNPASNNLGQRRPWYMSLERYAERLRRVYSEKYIELATAIGFSYVIKREVINKIGVLKVGYGLGNFEDTEYCIRASRNGYKSVIALGAYVWHAENASFDLLDNYEEMFKKNQKMFYELFGKPQRILYILTQKDKGYLERLKTETYELAKKCNWIWVVSPRRLGKLPLRVHANIIMFRYWPFFFRIRCIFRILVKKKKFNRITTNDKVIFSLLSALRRFHRAKLIKVEEYMDFDDSKLLRLNLGCLGRPCYGYLNIDERNLNKRIFQYRFSDLPFEDRTVKNILLDYKSISEKDNAEIDAIFKELGRVSVPGCILSIDNFSAAIKEKLSANNFIPVAFGYNRLFSAKSFIYKAPYARNDIDEFLKDLDGKTVLSLKVLNERLVSEKGEYINFFDKASLAQILEEKGFYISSLEVKDAFIEVKAARKKKPLNARAAESAKRICSIGQYMLLRYKGLGFDWDEWPRSFEKLGMDYLLIEGMRNIGTQKIREATLSFKPHYLLVVLKDNLPIIRDIRKELKSIGTQVIYWFCDPEIPKSEDFSDVIDVMFLTNRGQVDEYKKAYNLERVYYMPQGFGPYVQYRLNAPKIYDVGFAGAVSDVPLHKTRKELIDAMKRRYNVKVTNSIRNNIAEFYSQSKTVFGASDFDKELYTSNRFFVALGCGACYVTKKFKGIELLGENKKHLLWFEDREELRDILDYYISHDSEREKIRDAAQKLALEKHTYAHRIKNIMDILEGKTEKFYGFL